MRVHVCVCMHTHVHARLHERVTCETISQQAEHYKLQVVVLSTITSISFDQTLLLALVLHDQLHGLDCTGPEEVPLTQTQYNTFPKSLFITLHNTQFQPTTFY